MDYRAIGLASALLVACQTGLVESRDAAQASDVALAPASDAWVPALDACAQPNACGDCDPGCGVISIGPPAGAFPFGGDRGTDPNIVSEADGGLKVDGSGYLVRFLYADQVPIYELILRGCRGALPTDWRRIAWDWSGPETPVIDVDVRSGNTPVPDSNWGQYTRPVATSPLDLSDGVLVPNLPQGGDNYLGVRFVFGLLHNNPPPTLRQVDVSYRCAGP